MPFIRKYWWVVLGAVILAVVAVYYISQPPPSPTSPAEAPSSPSPTYSAPSYPAVLIASPASGTSTTDTSIAVTGVVGKYDSQSYGDLTLGVQVGTHAVIVPIQSDGMFSTNVDLSIGTNTIIVTLGGGENMLAKSVTVTRTSAARPPRATDYATYAVILVIVALILAAIAIFRKK